MKYVRTARIIVTKITPTLHCLDDKEPPRLLNDYRTGFPLKLVIVTTSPALIMRVPRASPSSDRRRTEIPTPTTAIAAINAATTIFRCVTRSAL
jgi:hypothetical protein